MQKHPSIAGFIPMQDMLVLCLDVFYDASCGMAAESSISLSVLGTANFEIWFLST